MIHSTPLRISAHWSPLRNATGWSATSRRASPRAPDSSPAGPPAGWAGRGFFVRPTVFSDATPDMAIVREEIFGPVLVIQAYDDEDEAVRLANDSIFGLNSGVFSGDEDHAGCGSPGGFGRARSRSTTGPSTSTRPSAASSSRATVASSANGVSRNSWRPNPCSSRRSLLLPFEPSMKGHPMAIEFNTLQRKTLTAIVDTVAAVPREDDPTGFYAAKGSDLGADVAAEQYLVTHLPDEQLVGLLQLIDTAGLVGLKNQPQAVREAIIADLAGISPETAGAVAALRQLSVMCAYGSPDAQGRNPLWAGMGYPGPAQGPPQTPKTLQVITPSGEMTLEADVVGGRLRQRAGASPPPCWRRPGSR